MNKTRDVFLSADEIEIIKLTQDIIKRMAENSSRTKTIFIAVTTAVVTFSEVQISLWTIVLLIAYLLITCALWQVDALYLRQERLFRQHYVAIVNKEISIKEAWNLNVSRYETEKVFHIMFRNYTMWIYQLSLLFTFVLTVYCFFHLPAR